MQSNTKITPTKKTIILDKSFKSYARTICIPIILTFKCLMELLNLFQQQMIDLKPHKYSMNQKKAINNRQKALFLNLKQLILCSNNNEQLRKTEDSSF